MTEQFAAPASQDSIDWQGVKGSLLLIEPLGVESDIATVHGPAAAVRATVTVLDGPHAGRRWEDGLIFPRVLQGQVRSKIGAKVLGRLGQGVPKPGQTAPWMLQEATADDVRIANDYVTRQRSQGFSQPSSSQPQGYAPQAAPTGSQPPF